MCVYILATAYRFELIPVPSVPHPFLPTYSHDTQTQSLRALQTTFPQWKRQDLAKLVPGLDPTGLDLLEVRPPTRDDTLCVCVYVCVCVQCCVYFVLYVCVFCVVCHIVPL